MESSNKKLGVADIACKQLLSYARNVRIESVLCQENISVLSALGQGLALALLPVLLG